jgi:enoyl-CoA hydratase/carnithine racemase
LADFRIASAESRFSANFALLGIHHGFALSVTLPAVVGQQAALDMLYTGRRVRGDEAHQMGLCDRMTSAETIQWEARSFAADIAAAAPLAVRSIRETMHRELLEKARLALTRERSEQERLMETDDWKRGVAAVNARARADFRRE